jgi:hypothetical protein
MRRRTQSPFMFMQSTYVQNVLKKPQNLDISLHRIPQMFS